MKTSDNTGEGGITSISDDNDHILIPAGGGITGQLALYNFDDSNTGGFWWIGDGEKLPIPAGKYSFLFHVGINNANIHVTGNGLKIFGAIF